ncbi:MAG: aromatic ring-hydroxylating dioxygenase subunit alpha [Acidobacteriota bacterium]|nr:aromatic ring-hydroxylating dioxygenase subunit alpha [Acidobacteriota bacterium]
MNPRMAPRPLDGRLYTDPAVFGDEMERIFSRMWVCGGRLEELDEPGRFVTREIGGESIVAARTAPPEDDAGSNRPGSSEPGALGINGTPGGATRDLAAFYNVCRHRGARVVDECAGTARVFQCPYHAWTYGLDGRLVGAPHMGNDFDAGSAGLVPVRIGAMDGFFFLSLAADGPPLAEVSADLPDLSRFTLGRLVRGDRHEYEARANWKILCENYNECYHCAVVHPELNRVSDYRNSGNLETGRFFVGGPMTLNGGCNTMTATGQSNRPDLPAIEVADRTSVQYYHVYPNLLISLHRDYVMTHTLWPIEAGRTRIVCEWLFDPDTAAAPGFDPSDAVDFWHLVNSQDWDVCARTQLGVASRGYRPTAYEESEACVQVFDGWYLDQMGL